MNLLGLLVVVCMLLGGGDWMMEVAVQAQQPSTYYGIYNLPSPLLVNNTKCRTPSPSFLCDPDQVLSEQDRQQLHLRLLKLEQDTTNPNVSDHCKAKGIRLSILIIQNDINIVSVQLPKTVGQTFYEQWAFDRDCGKTAMIVYCNQTKKSSLGLGTHNLPLFKDEFVHVIGMEERVLKENKVLQAFLEITNNLEKIAHNRAVLLGLRINGTAKKEVVLGLRDLAIVLLVTLLSASVVFGVLGCAYHRYWMSTLTKRDEKNMTASWKNPPNGTQAVHSHFVSEERVTTGPYKTPIPVVPY